MTFINITPLRMAMAMLFISSQAVAGHGSSTESPFQVSGFATVNYSISSSSTRYDRFIDSGGTFDASSILGIQGTYAFNPNTWATTQVALASDEESDKGLRPVVRWAYLAHEFGDHWIAKLGRQRLNVYRNAENLEVGSTYNQATLPKEIYVNPGFLSSDALSIRKRLFLTVDTHSEIGFSAGTKDTQSRALGANGQTVSYHPYDLKGANVFGSHHFADQSAVFASHLEFESNLLTPSGRVSGQGSLTSLAWESAPEVVQLALEAALISFDQDLTLAGSGTQVPLPAFKSLGLSANATWLESPYKPYLGYARNITRVGQTFGQWSVKTGLSMRFDQQTILKAELLHVNASSNPPNIYFDAPAGSSQQANILTLSLNRLF
ncbi:hypothetical protein [Limnobacter sp.]|uniref:hypothetical protein n=1 Tax=Limnobacter sp. TaxID=2003368 RepID=UPI0035122A5B